jgi:hypothetical protein
MDWQAETVQDWQVWLPASNLSARANDRTESAGSRSHGDTTSESDYSM